MKRKDQSKAAAICQETGDHVHYPPTRRNRSKRPPLHAPSPNLYAEFESSVGMTTRKVHYGECRKNQAADVGTTAYDGCGEFVTATTGEENPMNCGACGCDRSFHLEEESYPESSATNNGHASAASVLEVLKLSPSQFRQIFCSPYTSVKNGEVKEETTREKEEKEEEEEREKRLKTKFTAEQTEKMRNYAEKLQWKSNHANREEADKFCIEIGVNPKNFRIWMNNHKHINSM